MVRLVYINGVGVKLGDVVFLNGKKAVVKGYEKPHKPSSTGRVHVRREGAKWDNSYFPSVFDMEWIGRTDQ